MSKLEFTVQELENLLNEQKRVTANYITRNLTVYKWFENNPCDISLAKAELSEEVMKSGYPDDFNTLKKFLKD